MTKKNSIDFNDVLNGIVKVIMVVLVIIFIYMVILKIIGKSPGSEVVLIVGFSIILTFLISVNNKLFSINTKVTRIETSHKSLSDQFGRLAEDFKEHIKHK